MFLDLETEDNNGNSYNLAEVRNPIITNNENGFFTSEWELDRDAFLAWADTGFNYRATWWPPYGKLTGRQGWQGRVGMIEIGLNVDGTSTYKVYAYGMWSSAYDLYYSGILNTVFTGDTPESMIIQLMTPAYLPVLAGAETSGILPTGLANKIYLTPNYGTDQVKVGDVIKEICGLSNSNQQRVLPQVWENQKLQTYFVPATPTARYQISRNNISKLVLRRNSLQVYSSVDVRYKSFDGTLQHVIVNSQAVQSALAAGYASPKTFQRTYLEDMTASGPMGDTTQPTNIANKLLTRLAIVPNESEAIEITQDNVVFDLMLNSFIPNWMVRAGYYAEVVDILSRPSNMAQSGSAASDLSMQTMFYLSQCEYHPDTASLIVTPDGSSRLADVIIPKPPLFAF
jgi:hypothetical protein